MKRRNRAILRAEKLESRLPFSAAHDLIGVTALRADAEFAGIDGSGVTVAVIDTGIDITHPLLAPNYLRDASGQPIGQDFVRGGANPRPVDLHGTHVAGIIGATDPDIGVAPGVGLIGLQVFNSAAPGQHEPTAALSTITEALQWVIEHHDEYNIVAVNMSLGAGFFENADQAARYPYADEIEFLEQQGVAIVSTAGNDFDFISHLKRLRNQGSLYYAGSPGILSSFNVGAVYEGDDEPPLRNVSLTFDVNGDGYADEYIVSGDREPNADQIVYFSQRPHPSYDSTIFAPGAVITSTIPGGKLYDTQGTSMAAPMVAGVVALLQQTALEHGGRMLTVPQLQAFIQETADTITDDAPDTQYIHFRPGDPSSTPGWQPMLLTDQSYRRINAYRAAQRVIDYFAGLDDADGTISTASPGRNVFGTSGALSRLGQLKKAESERPIVAELGRDGDREVGARDVDMYRLEVLTPGELTAWTYDPTSSTTSDNANTFLRLFRPDGTPLASDDNSFGGGYSRLSLEVAAGTYYVGVSGAPNTTYNPNSLGAGRNGSEGAYALRFALESVDTDGTLATATDLGTLSNQLTMITAALAYDDSLDRRDDRDLVDIYRIEVKERSTLRLDLDSFTTVNRFNMDFRNPLYDNNENLTNVNQGIDSYLRIFDAKGNELDRNDNGFATAIGQEPREVAGQDYLGWTFHEGDEPEGALSRLGKLRASAHGRNDDSYLETTLDRGVYYIGVSTANNATYDPRTTAGRTQQISAFRYDLTASLTFADVDGVIPRAANASTISLALGNSQSIRGAIGRDGGATVEHDVDFLRVVPASSGLLDIDIDAMTSAAFPSTNAVDSVVSLWDSLGNLLGTNDDDGESMDSRLRVSVSAGQAYYVSVAGAGNTTFDPLVPGDGSPGSQGDYELTITLSNQGVIQGLINDTTASGEVAQLRIGESIAEFIGSDHGVIRGATDVDLFRFTADTSELLTFSTGSAATRSANTFLRLFQEQNGQLQEVASNDDAAPRTHSSAVTLRVEAGETYYVGVNGASAAAGSYNPTTGAGAASGDMGPYLLSVTVSSVNLAPQAVDDMVHASEDGITTFRDALLANDSDPDPDDVLSIKRVPTTSRHGAALSLNAAGEVVYDPANATAIQALLNGQTLEDSFSYWISDLEGAEAMAEVTVQVHGINPYTNSDLPEDSTADGRVVPLDALVIINNLNEHGPRLLVEGVDEPRFAYDVNNDGHVTSADVLLVINYLNRATGRGEGERSRSAAVEFTFPTAASAPQTPSRIHEALDQLFAEFGDPDIDPDSVEQRDAAWLFSRNAAGTWWLLQEERNEAGRPSQPLEDRAGHPELMEALGFPAHLARPRAARGEL